MTLWLSNLAAYSLQLAALVGAAVLLVAVLRIEKAHAALRFWQALLAASVVWPCCQLWATGDTSASALAPGAIFASAAGWTVAAPGVASMRDAIAAIGSGVATVVIGVLAAGIFVRVGWIGVGLLRLRVVRQASEAADALSPVAAPLQRELAVAADIRFSDAVDSPATIGARRPTVLLPRQVRDLPAPVQRAVLCHELLHVRRGDWLPSLCEELWCALLWFHPAARAMASRLSLAREMLVDQATIAQTRDRRAYAEALLVFSSASARLPGANAFIGRRHLERRIHLLSQEAPMSRFALGARLAVAGSLVALATLVTTSNMPLTASLHAQQSTKVYKPGAGITLPQVVREVKPQYTPAAMKAKIQGSVHLSVVVLDNGDVGEVLVIKSLDKEHGLDDEAVSAARQWKFKPGTREGKPVAVQVTVELTFTLKG